LHVDGIIGCTSPLPPVVFSILPLDLVLAPDYCGGPLAMILSINAFDFSNKKMQLIDAFAKLILQQNKEALESVVEEVLKD
jgi:hypothetical protein